MNTFLFVLVALISHRVSSAEECCNCETPNVKSVIFKRIDLHRECWTPSDVALLFARRLMQELVPRKVPFNIPLVKQYLDLCEETVNQVASSNASRILLQAAFADTMGGYLYTYGLPLAKQIYYEGKTDVKQTKLLFDLENRFKISLGTNGNGWKPPISVRKFATKILPLRIARPPVDRDICQTLITNDLLALQSSKNGENHLGSKTCSGEKIVSSEEMKIPLPFLDDNESPRAVAVPFRNQSLYSLLSPVSADVLTKYYTISLQCLKSNEKDLVASHSVECHKLFCSHNVQKFTQDAEQKFESDFFRWIHDKIVPHLDDEVWYTGFGGVLRIAETIRRKGFLENNLSLFGPQQPQPFSLPGLHRNPLLTTDFISGHSRPGENVKVFKDRFFFDQKNHSKLGHSITQRLPAHPSTQFYLLAVVLIILSFWILICIIHVCCKLYHIGDKKSKYQNKRKSKGKVRYRRSESKYSDDDPEELESGDEEILLGSTTNCRLSIPKELSGVGSSLSNFCDKFLTDNDLVLSSTGVSYSLSDATEITSTKLSSLKNENDEIIIRKQEIKAKKMKDPERRKS